MDGGEAGFDVALDAAQVLVPGLGHDDVGGEVGVAEVGGGGVTELVQSQPAAVAGEQDAGPVVAEPGTAGFGADVARVGGGAAVRPGPVLRQEQGAAGAAGDQPGQQVCGVGAPGDPHDVAALGGDPGLLAGQVQVLSLQAEHPPPPPRPPPPPPPPPSPPP